MPQCRISIKLSCRYIEITLRHGCFLVNLLDIFGILFPLNSAGGLLLRVAVLKFVRDAKIVLQSTAHFFVVNFKSIFHCLKGILKGKVRSFQKLKEHKYLICYVTQKYFCLKTYFFILLGNFTFVFFHIQKYTQLVI